MRKILLLCLALLALPAFGQGTRISNLPSGAPAQGTDQIPIARGAANYKLTVANILAGNAATATALAADPTDCASFTVATGIATSANLSCSTLTLASGYFANQGTTTTVLHGNAAGNPSWGPIVGADISAGTITPDKLSSVSGNGAAVVTTTGAQTAGECVTIDASGNHVAAGAACGSGGGGGGDFSSNTATSVDGEVVLFSGGAGKTGRRATQTGLGLLTSGVLSAYGGSSCTNQFVRSTNASGTHTCATVGTSDVASGITLDTEWDTIAEIEAATGGVNIILATEIDTSAELAAILTDETGSGGGFMRATGPTASDLVVTGSLNIPNGAAPTTDAAGEIAFDNNAHAASRGAVQVFDGTANTWLIGALASDTPTNGQMPVWNTGGTITWETISSVGDITDVVAGDGLTGGSSSGSASLNVVGGVGITANADDIAVNTAELAGSLTFGDASTDTIVWTWNRATGTDPTMTINSGSVDFSGLTIGGQTIASFTDPNADKILYWRDSDGTIQPVTIGAGVDLTSGTLTSTLGTTVALTELATQATNTVVANVTSGTATPTAHAMTSCSTSASAVNYTTNTGFGCNTAVNAAQLNGATFAAPGTIGGTTPGSATVTTLTANTAINLPHSTSLPGTCNTGDAYMDTDATSGQRFYLCQAANTWALQGDGGGGGSQTHSILLKNASGTGAYTHTGDTTETVLATVTLPALSAGDVIRVRANLSRTANGDVNHFYLKFNGTGGTTIWSEAFGAGGQSGAAHILELMISNRGATNSQIMTGNLIRNDNAVVYYSGTTAVQTNTGSVTLDLSCLLDSVTTNTLTVEQLLIERVSDGT